MTMRMAKPKCGSLLCRTLIGMTMMLAAGALQATTESPYATGGNVTQVDLGNLRVRYIHVFTNTDEVATFRNTGKRTLSLRYLVVGGGGSGGYGSNTSGGQWSVSGAGGGGGGVREVKDVPFAAGAEWSILVGKGAKAVVSTSNKGTAAGTSSITNNAVGIATVHGGGNGAKAATGTAQVVAATDGAAGGGGTAYATDPGSGTFPSSVFGVSPEGAPFAGGEYTKSSYLGAGGGGAGAAGGKSSSTRAGAGGEGLASDITGERLVYGSGGGGGANTYRNRAGGLGGSRAGNGATYEVVGTTTNFTAATTPAANSGCGGAGGMQDGNCNAATDGADGVVVIQYDIIESPCAGGDVVTRRHVRGTRYSYIHIFTNVNAVASFENLSDSSLSLRYLVVGAGGAGARGVNGAAGGAGGGGGGVIEAKGLSFVSGARLYVEVGKGAPERSTANFEPVAGSSILSNDEVVVASALGGGNAALYSATEENRRAATGGANGGGGVRNNTAGAVGTFVSSLNGVSYGPFKGGDYNSAGRVGGSGAGAGENGRTAPDKYAAGVGGEGLTSDITGEALVYGSGGGAGEGFFAVTEAFPGCQGSVGGTRAGNGAMHDFTMTDNGDGSVTTNFNYIVATKPVANSGAGGAGGGQGRQDSTGKSRYGTGGADGIVVLRYDYDPTPPGVMIILR